MFHKFGTVTHERMDGQAARWKNIMLKASIDWRRHENANLI